MDDWKMLNAIAKGDITQVLASIPGHAMIQAKSHLPIMIWGASPS
jgi:hypothetical protein